MGIAALHSTTLHKLYFFSSNISKNKKKKTSRNRPQTFYLSYLVASGCRQKWDSNFLSAASITKVIFSAGSVSTNSTRINSDAGRFADMIKFCETVPSESMQFHNRSGLTPPPGAGLLARYFLDHLNGLASPWSWPSG